MRNKKLNAALFSLVTMITLPNISLGSYLDCFAVMPNGTYVGHFTTIISRDDWESTNLMFQVDAVNTSGCVQFKRQNSVRNKIIMNAFFNHRDVTITVSGNHYITGIAYSNED